MLTAAILYSQTNKQMLLDRDLYFKQLVKMMAGPQISQTNANIRCSAAPHDEYQHQLKNKPNKQTNVASEIGYLCATLGCID